MFTGHLWDVTSYLLNPGTALEVTIKSNELPIVVRLDRYKIDLHEGTLTLSGLAIRDEDHTLLGAAKAVSVDFRSVTEMLHRPVVRARVVQPNLSLRRLKNGRFDIERFVSKEPGEPSTVPLEVLITQASLKLVDDRSGETIALQAPGAKFVTLGNDWNATAELVIPGAARGQVNARQLDSGDLHIAINQLDWSSTEAIRRILKPDLPKELDWATASGAGTVLAHLPKARAGTFTYSGSVAVSAPKWQKYTLDAVSFDGIVTESHVAGSAELKRGREKLSTKFATRFRGQLTYSAELAGTTTSISRIPEVRKQMPKGLLAAGAKANGYVHGNGSNINYSLVGKLEQLRYETIAVRQLSFAIAGNEKQLRLAPTELSTNLGDLTAFGRFDLKKQTVIGGISIKNVDVARLSRFGVPKEIRGTFAVKVHIGGSVDRPQVRFQAAGRASYTARNLKEIRADQVEVVGSFANGVAKFNRAIAQIGDSAVGANGTVDAEGPIALRVAALDVDLSQLSAKAKGIAEVLADVTGTIQRPKIDGSAEAYLVEYENFLVPAMRMDLVGGQDSVTFKNMLAVRGPTEVGGDVQLNLRDSKLSGTAFARRVQLSTFLGGETIGALSSESITISGSVSDPELHATLEGKNLVLSEIGVDELSLPIDYRNGVARIAGANIELYGGKVAVNAEYSTLSRTGSLQADFAEIALKDASSATADLADASGVARGTLTASLDPDGRINAELKSELDEVQFNGTLIGAGDLLATYDGNAVSSSLTLGQLDRFIEARVDGFDFETRQFSAEVAVFNLLVEDFIQTSNRYLQTAPYEVRSRLKALEGKANFLVKAFGRPEDLSVDLENFRLTDLAIESNSIGILEAKGSWRDRTTVLESFTIRGPAANVSITGRAVENGQVLADGEIDNLSIEYLSKFIPELTGQTGRVSLPFAITGTIQEPVVLASLTVDGLLENPDIPDSSLFISMDQIKLSKGDGTEGGAQVTGAFRYRGFEGQLGASAAFEYPFVIPDAASIKGFVRLNERPLQEIAEFSAALDGSQAKGTLNGQLEVLGTAREPRVTGVISAKVEEARLRAVPNGVRNGALDVRLEPNAIALNSQFELIQGGTGDVAMQSSFGSLGDLIQGFQRDGINFILDQQISGILTFRDAQHGQELSGGSVRARANVDLKVEGELRSPRISGDVDLISGDIVVPQIETDTKPSPQPLVEPTFDVKIKVEDFTRVQAAGAADLYLYGDAALTGSLTKPRLASEIFVERGTFQLPGGKVRLDQGGTVDVEFDASTRTPAAVMNVNLQGRTAVTTTLVTQLPERYDILVNVTGDLLREGGIQLSAESDPPGLSQNQIISLLGRTDVIEGFANTGERNLAEERLRSAVVGLAVPLVFERLTSPLAQGLGLDFLSLEYNQFEKGTIVAAKNIGRDFIVQVRRQVGQPLPGFPIRYEYRLDYRPRKLKGWFSRVSFFVGQDELRPWKLGFNYTVRF